MAANNISSANTSGFSARLMIGKGADTMPGSLGLRSPKKMHSMGNILEIETLKQETKSCYTHSNPGSSQPPSKTSNCKDKHSLWKSVQDCHASLTVANPRHFEFAVANLCFLLKAYGRDLDNYVKADVDKIFQTLRILALDISKRPTTRIQLLKVIELRARSWEMENRMPQHLDKGIIQGVSGTQASVSTTDNTLVGLPSLSGGVSRPVQYSREFLLKCWDSPLCRLMPAALQQTIPHSDIYYLKRIPTFEDPSFLLKDVKSPVNIKATGWGPYPDKSNRNLHSGWPSTMHSET
ncbi:uncharacterized protein LOC110979986 isoform X1 [Acanthaster planci]|uniref:Uncharacterized protein LOC110979986 isoform X1 n=1 Tax=Acanthaster planci TaxID=133434 RepID=A0A8B7YF87_ACAPL|nr:uncharacterized protein LOC110979986 isoform X1 [Acanthaster planci]XP_022091903.1 uncharacterized protein LOC110979986 isoform X1 [Acanthaster planci]